MSGHKDYNYPAFRAAAERLRALGHDVVCPPELNQPGESLDLPASHFLRRDLRGLLDCEGIALLAGWQRSVGASCEVAVALALGMQFFNTFGDRLIGPAKVICRPYMPVGK